MAQEKEKQALIDESKPAVVHEINKKDLKAKLEAEAENLYAKQNQLALLEKELEQNEVFKNFLNLQKAVKSQDSLFRESVKNEMIKYDIPKLQGDWGTITLVEKELYKVIDDVKVPEEYKEEKTIIEVDLKAIKEDYILTGVLPAGVQVKKSQYILVKEKK